MSAERAVDWSQARHATLTRRCVWWADLRHGLLDVAVGPPGACTRHCHFPVRNQRARARSADPFEPGGVRAL